MFHFLSLVSLQLSGWKPKNASELHFISNHHNATFDHKNVTFPRWFTQKAFAWNKLPFDAVMNQPADNLRLREKLSFVAETRKDVSSLLAHSDFINYAHDNSLNVSSLTITKQETKAIEAVNEMRNFIRQRWSLFGYSKKVDNNRKVEDDPKWFSSFFGQFRSRMTFSFPARTCTQTLTIKFEIGIRHHL